MEYDYIKESQSKAAIYKNGYIIKGDIIELHIFSKKKDTVILIDRNDFEQVKSYFWCRSDVGPISNKKPMIYANYKGSKLKLSRIIIPSVSKGETIEHLNRNCLDFRKENLNKINGIKLRETNRNLATGIFEIRYKGQVKGYKILSRNQNKIECKCFTRKMYSSVEAAYKAACDYRNQMIMIQYYSEKKHA